MAGCSYVERRGSRYYFRLRMPLDVAPVIGRTHVVAALGTADAREAKIKSARLFLSLATILETMRARMARAFDIDGNQDCGRLEMLAAAAFALGQEYAARRESLKQEFSVRLGQAVAGLRENATPMEAASLECGDPEGVMGFVSRKPAASSAGSAFHVPPPVPAAAPASPAWTELKQGFFNDKSGLSGKTLWSYNQAFAAWEGLIGRKPVADIRRSDVKAYADFLRDKENPRGGKLHCNTIQRSLGHIKTFMAWTVREGHTDDDRFDIVVGRNRTRQEQLAGDRRRALSAGELARMFHSPFFTRAADESEVAAGWFLALAALTGARTSEIALAPARLVVVGDFHCLDLRKAGRKTSAAPRLVPLLPDLLKMGLLGWAKKQETRGYALVQPGAEPRSAAAWSKLLNRYLNANVTDEPEVVLYSLRHSFRQMLRAGNIGDELADKIFGHATGRIGAGYGRDLSPAEAELFVANVKAPADLRHLWRTN